MLSLVGLLWSALDQEVCSGSALLVAWCCHSASKTWVVHARLQQGAALMHGEHPMAKQPKPFADTVPNSARFSTGPAPQCESGLSRAELGSCNARRPARTATPCGPKQLAPAHAERASAVDGVLGAPQLDWHGAALRQRWIRGRRPRQVTVHTACTTNAIPKLSWQQPASKRLLHQCARMHFQRWPLPRARCTWSMVGRSAWLHCSCDGSHAGDACDHSHKPTAH